MAWEKYLAPSPRGLCRNALLAAVALCGTTAGLADAATDLAPTMARLVKLGAISTLTYYTVEKEGFRVVTTIQSDDTVESYPPVPPVRFIVTLAPREEARISVPRDSGPAIELRIARIGDVIEVSRTDPADAATADRSASDN